MNRRRLLDRLSDASEAVERLREELNEIKGSRDDFAAFLFNARKCYRRSVETSGKSGKGIQDTIRSTFREAMALGFKGPYEGWKHLLDIPAKGPEIDPEDMLARNLRAKGQVVTPAVTPDVGKRGF